MSSYDIVRAWKDADYRASLSDAELAQLPANPAGFVELADDDLDQAAGGAPNTLNLNCVKTYQVGCYSYDKICPVSYMWPRCAVAR